MWPRTEVNVTDQRVGQASIADCALHCQKYPECNMFVHTSLDGPGTCVIYTDGTFTITESTRTAGECNQTQKEQGKHHYGEQQNDRKSSHFEEVSVFGEG